MPSSFLPVLGGLQEALYRLAVEFKSILEHDKMSARIKVNLKVHL